MGIDIFLEKCYLRESVFGMLFNKEGLYFGLISNPTHYSGGH